MAEADLVTSRKSLRAQFMTAITAGDLALVARLGQRLSRIEPPGDDDLALAATARMIVGDRAGILPLLERALIANPRPLLAAKILARFYPGDARALPGLIWHADSDRECIDLIAAYVAASGQPVGLAWRGQLWCVLPPGGGRLTVAWQGMAQPDMIVPDSNGPVLFAVPVPALARGGTPILTLNGAPVLTPGFVPSMLLAPQLSAQVAVDQHADGTWTLKIQALNHRIPDRPLAILVLDGEQVHQVTATQPQPDVWADEAADMPILSINLPASVSAPRLRFDLTGEPLALPLPLAPAEPDGTAIDIVVPVYGDLIATRACLSSLLACDPGWPCRVIAIDDGSPDPAISTLLDGLAAAGRLTLVRNPGNLGFVRSVNIGMAQSAGRDVVLLNADTLLAPGWLWRLRRAALSAADIGTVTPLSNDATICSYPGINEPTALDKVDVDRLHDLAGRELDGATVTIPTAVGFCMYIRRECLDRTGWFDADAFGLGYGEENDFCRRALNVGWRHVAALDCYVGHVGGGSFGATKRRRIATALDILDHRYPEYHGEIARFIAADPMAPARRTLDRAQWLSQAQHRTLLVCARLGGGTDRHVDERRDLLANHGGSLLLRPVPATEQRSRYLMVEVPDLAHLTNLRYDPATEMELLLADLIAGGVREMELHHAFHLPTAALTLLARTFPYHLRLHDYSWICPRITMTDGDGKFCDDPPVEQCERCIATHGDLMETGMPVADWRAVTAPVLAGARPILCATRDTAVRIARHVPGAALALAPLEPSTDSPIIRRTALTGRTFNVLVPGAIGLAKGFTLLLRCAEDAAARDLPLSFHLLGYSMDDEALLATGKAFATGKFTGEAEVPDLIATLDPHVGFLPSRWPETWCYALTHLLKTDLPLAGFDIGAQAERLRTRPGSMLLPLSLSASAINDLLLRFAQGEN